WHAYIKGVNECQDYYAQKIVQSTPARTASSPAPREGRHQPQARRSSLTGEPLSLPISGVAPELRRRERSGRLVPLALLSPAILIAILFLYYPLLFIVQMSFTLANTYLSPAGPTMTIENYQAMVGRYLPNVLVTLQLAGLATIVNLIFGFPFAYILVRRVRYRDLLGALMVFGWNIGTFAEPLLLGSINEQKSLAWTLYQRGVVQTDYGLSTTMGVVLLVIAFIVTYFSLRFSRGALVE